MIVGEVILAGGEIEINKGKEAITVDVTNNGTRPVQIGSHFHFYEANECMTFDREKTYGYRPDIPAGTAVRFEPKETKKVKLIKMGGKRKVYGANGKVNGFLDEKKQLAGGKKL